MDIAKLPFDADTMLAGLKPWVEIESPTFDAARVNVMLDHVARPRSFLNAAQETTRFLIAAAMRFDSRHYRDQSIVKPIDLARGQILILLDIKAHNDQHFPVAAPVIRAP